MFKKLNTLLIPLVFASFAQAEVRPFINADLGIADTDYDNGGFYDVGAGLQFNDNVEFEISYNDYGDIGPFGIEITSIAYGLNLGGKVSENTRIFAILGAERLEADDTANFGSFSVKVDESSTEAFFGVGAAFSSNEHLAIRTKLVSHDSADIITFSVGMAIYF